MQFKFLPLINVELFIFALCISCSAVCIKDRRCRDLCPQPGCGHSTFSQSLLIMNLPKWHLSPGVQESLLNLVNVRVDGMKKCERNLFFMSFLFTQGEVAASKSLVTCTVFVTWPFNAITIFQSLLFFSLLQINHYIKKRTILSMEGSCWVVIVLFSKLQEFNCKGHTDNLGQSMSQQCLIY